MRKLGTPCRRPDGRAARSVVLTSRAAWRSAVGTRGFGRGTSKASVLNCRVPTPACRPPCGVRVEAIDATRVLPQRLPRQRLLSSLRPRPTARAAAFVPAPAGRRETARASAQDLHQRGQPLHQPLQQVQHGRHAACVHRPGAIGACASRGTPAPDQPLRASPPLLRHLSQCRLEAGPDARPGLADLLRFFRNRSRVAAINRPGEAPNVACRVAVRVPFTSGSHDRVPFESSPAETHAGIALAKLIRPSPMPIRPSPIWLNGSPPGS
jgi:hypothetical protein